MSKTPEQELKELKEQLKQWADMLDRTQQSMQQITPGNVSHHVGSVRHSLLGIASLMRIAVKEGRVKAEG